MNDSSGTAIKAEINGITNKGFFLAEEHWTCYRRNYFSVLLHWGALRLAIAEAELVLAFGVVCVVFVDFIGGWDISSLNLAAAMDRAKVLQPTLKALVRKEMAEMVPLPSIYYPDFIAANQKDRDDNILPGSRASMAHVEQIRKDIRDFKIANGLDKVIVQWTANIERFSSRLR
ncbi:hypothetical protein V8F06_014741, partial [Rhypophila decipiens]